MMPEGFWPDELSVSQVKVERLRRDKRNVRNEAIEECARVVDCLGRDAKTAPAFECAAAAIRALKKRDGYYHDGEDSYHESLDDTAIRALK